MNGRAGGSVWLPRVQCASPCWHTCDHLLQHQPKSLRAHVTPSCSRESSGLQPSFRTLGNLLCAKPEEGGGRRINTDAFSLYACLLRVTRPAFDLAKYVLPAVPRGSTDLRASKQYILWV